MSRGLVVLGAAAIQAFFFSGCCRPPEDKVAAAREGAKVEAPVDSPENRRAEALSCIAAYPAAEFGADLAEQAQEILGRDLAEEVRAKFRQRVSLGEFEETRIKILTQIFTPAELQKLAEIYRTPGGKALLKKLRRYDEQWREYLAPGLFEALSNSP